MSAQGQFDQRLLALVTLALVSFGLVMVYSATSASAARALTGGRVKRAVTSSTSSPACGTSTTTGPGAAGS